MFNAKKKIGGEMNSFFDGELALVFNGLWAIGLEYALKWLTMILKSSSIIKS